MSAARSLSCSDCGASFGIRDWRLGGAACPACGRRVSFFRAAGLPEPDSRSHEGSDDRQLPAATSVTSAPPCAARTGARERRLFGKPLRWTRGWTAVALVWLLVGSLLGLARLDMGHLTALTAHEQSAIAAVTSTRLDDGRSCGDLLALLSTRYAGVLLGTSRERTVRWFAIDRSWEHRVYVVWQLGGKVELAFTVQEGRVAAESETALFLKSFARATAAAGH
jgi:DNA-directed RNA polymerase subunit RPC12/RpoP